MRPAEIRGAEARVIEARASQRSAEETARRQETLLANGAVSQQSATESRARAEETRARLHVAEAALNLAREGFRAEDVDAGRAALAAAEARLRAAETRLADATLKAPSAGVVLARVREPGAIVQQGETAFTLALDRPLWVRAYVQGEDLARVVPGELRQTTDHARAAEQVEIVRERRRIAGVLELAEHLRVREDLAGVATAELEEPPQERRLVDPGQQ